MIPGTELMNGLDSPTKLSRQFRVRLFSESQRLDKSLPILAANGRGP